MPLVPKAVGQEVRKAGGVGREVGDSQVLGQLQKPLTLGQEAATQIRGDSVPFLPPNSGG